MTKAAPRSAKLASPLATAGNELSTAELLALLRGRAGAAGGNAASAGDLLAQLALQLNAPIPENAAENNAPDDAPVPVHIAAYDEPDTVHVPFVPPDFAASPYWEATGDEHEAFSAIMVHLISLRDYFRGTVAGRVAYNRLMSDAFTSFMEMREVQKDHIPFGTYLPSVDLSFEPVSVVRIPTDPSKCEAAERKKRIGDKHHDNEEYEAAISCYSECLELDNGSTVYYTNRAAARMYCGDYADALQDCKKALFLDPTCLRAYQRIAVVYARKGFFEREIAVLEKGLSYLPENQDLLYMKAKAEKKLKQTRRTLVNNMTEEPENTESRAVPSIAFKVLTMGHVLDQITKMNPDLEMTMNQVSKFYASNIGQHAIAGLERLNPPASTAPQKAITAINDPSKKDANLRQVLEYANASINLPPPNPPEDTAQSPPS